MNWQYINIVTDLNDPYETKIWESRIQNRPAPFDPVDVALITPDDVRRMVRKLEEKGLW